METPSVKNKKVSVLGSQRSAMGAARLLSHFGAKVLLSEINPDLFTAEKRQILADIGAEFEFGYHSPDVLESDFVVVSPGIPENIEIMHKIREQDIPVYSEIEITSWFIEAPIIAVTGSNGKTTTVNLIHHLLKTAGYDSFLGGNVGYAASDVLLESFEIKAAKPVFVLEVSSFQLDNIEYFKPDVAVILNLTPDHLDRYPSLDAYYSSKIRIFENLDANDVAVINRDDPELIRRDIVADNKRFFAVDNQSGGSAMFAEGALGIMRESGWDPILSAKELPIPGRHNLSNALAAIAAIIDFINEPEVIARGLVTVSAVPHRIEYVGTVNGILCYNDSKATNIASTEVAIRSFIKPMWLILGGKDKGGDFTLLVPGFEEHAREILLIGDAANLIETQIGRSTKTHKLETIEQAVDYCLKNGEAGDILLLSPACASFDQFENFEARGDFFRDHIQSQKGWSM